MILSIFSRVVGHPYVFSVEISVRVFCHLAVSFQSLSKASFYNELFRLVVMLIETKNKTLIMILHYSSNFDVLDVTIFHRSASQLTPNKTCRYAEFPRVTTPSPTAWVIHSHLHCPCPLHRALGVQLGEGRSRRHSCFLQVTKIHEGGQRFLFQDTSQKW